MATETAEITVTLTPALALENLNSAIARAQAEQHDISTQIQTLEALGDFEGIQQQDLHGQLSSADSLIAYYQGQIPRLELSIKNEAIKLRKIEAVQKLENAQDRIQTTVSEFNDAREKMLQASARLESLDRELGPFVATVNDRLTGGIFPNFPEWPESLPSLHIRQDGPVCSVIFYQAI
jgi:peptidoglycan hydrolase CwlO-like protein